ATSVATLLPRRLLPPFSLLWSPEAHLLAVAALVLTLFPLQSAQTGGNAHLVRLLDFRFVELQGVHQDFANQNLAFGLNEILDKFKPGIVGVSTVLFRTRLFA